MEEQPINKSNVIKLKHILETSRCNHKIEIMKELNIKGVHIYCKIHQLAGQISGPLIEHYIKSKYGMKKNNSSLCIGDLEGELFIFKLTKINIKKLILKYGGYAHGTKQKLGEITEEDLENSLNDKEYTIRPKYGDKCWKELLQFRVDEI